MNPVTHSIEVTAVAIHESDCVHHVSQPDMPRSDMLLQLTRCEEKRRVRDSGRHGDWRSFISHFASHLISL